jgi:2-iminobutanoate/2-iminopropanoate deaminase
MKAGLLIIFVGILIGFSVDKKRVVLTKNAPAPIGPYSQAIRNGNTIYVSGQIGWRADGTPDTTSIENETRQALDNAKAILLEAGVTLQQVCKVTVYCTDLKQFAKINTVYAGYFPTQPPARETVEVRALPKNAHVEISMIAED